MMSTGTPILIVTKQNQPVGVITARDLVQSPKRCKADIAAVIDTLDESPAARHQVVITQLSHDGALVESPVRLLAGIKIILTFSLPQTSSPLAIQGTVLHGYDQMFREGKMPASLASGVEIQFTHLSPPNRSTIQAWVLHNSPSSSKSA